MLLSAVSNLKNSEDEELHFLMADNHIFLLQLPWYVMGMLRCRECGASVLLCAGQRTFLTHPVIIGT